MEAIAQDESFLELKAQEEDGWQVAEPIKLEAPAPLSYGGIILARKNANGEKYWSRSTNERLHEAFHVCCELVKAVCTIINCSAEIHFQKVKTRLIMRGKVTMIHNCIPPGNLLLRLI